VNRKKLVLHRSSRQPAFSFDPLVKKVLSRPSCSYALEDNISDIDRITRELQKSFEFMKNMKFRSPVCKNLTEKLRAHHWKVTVTFAASQRRRAYFTN